MKKRGHGLQIAYTLLAAVVPIIPFGILDIPYFPNNH